MQALCLHVCEGLLLGRDTCGIFEMYIVGRIFGYIFGILW